MSVKLGQQQKGSFSDPAAENIVTDRTSVFRSATAENGNELA